MNIIKEAARKTREESATLSGEVKSGAQAQRALLGRGSGPQRRVLEEVKRAPFVFDNKVIW